MLKIIYDDLAFRHFEDMTDLGRRDDGYWAGAKLGIANGTLNLANLRAVLAEMVTHTQKLGFLPYCTLLQPPAVVLYGASQSKVRNCSSQIWQ